MQQEIQKSMSCRKIWRPAGLRHLPIIVSDGMVNGRESSGRYPTKAFGYDKPFYMNGNNGFTLIELLVVVLIIGILAAVALPQYTLAVNKTRFANLRSSATAIVNAARAYHLANGSWPDNFDVLSVDVLAGFSPISTSYNTSCKQNEEMYCCISAGTTGSWAPGVTCGRKDFSFGFEHQLETGDISSNDKSYCVAKTTDTNAVKLCNTLGKSVGPWNNTMSPQGIKNGYTWRKLD